MMSFNMQSDSPWAPELDPKASYFAISLTTPNKTSPLKILSSPHSLIAFSMATTRL